MTTNVDSARSALLDTIQALVVRRDATNDPQEKAAINAEIDRIDRSVTRLALDNLAAASQQVSEAADKVDAILRTAKVNPFDSTIDASLKALAKASVRLSNEASQAFVFDAPRALDATETDSEVDVTAPAPPVEDKTTTRPAAAATNTTPSRPAAPSETTAPAPTAPGSLPPIVSGKTLQALARDYELCWGACAIRPDRRADVQRAADRLSRGEQRYKAVSTATGVPWQLIGLMHGLECGYDFNKHLHNGDSLAAATVHVPAGRPPGWVPGSPWEQSAADALKLKKLDQVSDWSLPRVLYVLEAYNGFGYRGHDIRSPYLWSFSNLYEKGKYVADHQFDPNAVSKQVGSAVVLKLLSEGGLWP